MLALRIAQRLRTRTALPGLVHLRASAQSTLAPHQTARQLDADAAALQLDRIHLEDMQFFGYHGVLPEETRDGQDFYVDATLHVDLRSAGTSDDLMQTVNYAEVFSNVQKVLEGEPQQLIETVAHRAACAILRQHPRVQLATIRVDKPQAPIEGEFGTVAVEVTRGRADL